MSGVASSARVLKKAPAYPAAQEIIRPHAHPAKQVFVFIIQGQGPGRLQNNAHLIVILQIFADLGSVVNYVDAMFAETGAIADAGEFQQLG